MHLAKVGQVRLFSSKVSMSHVRSSMGVSFSAMTCHKHDLALRALAEIVPAIGGDRHDGTLKRWHKLPKSCGPSERPVPPLAQIMRDFRKGHRVQDAIGRFPALASHLDAPMYMVEFADRMGIRIDAHHAPEVERRMPAPTEIRPPRVGVDFDGDGLLGTGAEDFLNFDFISGPALELSPRYVADDRRVRVGARTKQASGLCLSVQLEAAVDAGDDEIERRQHLA